MRKEIEKRLRILRSEKEVIHREIESRMIRSESIRAVVSELELLLKKVEKNDSGLETDRELRQGTDVYKVREVLRAVGSVLYIDDIIRALDEPVTPERRRSLASQIAAYVRKDEIFSRPAPNTFGLKNFDILKEEFVTEEPLREEEILEPWDDEDDIPF